VPRARTSDPTKRAIAEMATRKLLVDAQKCVGRSKALIEGSKALIETSRELRKSIEEGRRPRGR
jgi:hypothetical protein